MKRLHFDSFLNNHQNVLDEGAWDWIKDRFKSKLTPAPPPPEFPEGPNDPADVESHPEIIRITNYIIGKLNLAPGMTLLNQAGEPIPDKAKTGHFLKWDGSQGLAEFKSSLSHMIASQIFSGAEKKRFLRAQPQDAKTIIDFLDDLKDPDPRKDQSLADKFGVTSFGRVLIFIQKFVPKVNPANQYQHGFPELSREFERARKYRRTPTASASTYDEKNVSDLLDAVKKAVHIYFHVDPTSGKGSMRGFKEAMGELLAAARIVDAKISDPRKTPTQTSTPPGTLGTGTS